jgi:hypothetical protein
LQQWAREREEREQKSPKAQGYEPSFDLAAFEKSTLVAPIYEEVGGT